MEIIRKAEIFVNENGNKVHVLTLVDPKTKLELSDEEVIKIGEPKTAYFGEYPIPTRMGIPYDLKFPIDGVSDITGAFKEFEAQFESYMKMMREQAEKAQNDIVVPNASQARNILNSESKTSSGLIVP